MTEHGFTPTRDDPASWAGREKAHIDEIDALKARVAELEAEVALIASILPPSGDEIQVRALEVLAVALAWRQHAPVIEAVRAQVIARRLLDEACNRMDPLRAEESEWRQCCMRIDEAARKAGLGEEE